MKPKLSPQMQETIDLIERASKCVPLYEDNGIPCYLEEDYALVKSAMAAQGDITKDSVVITPVQQDAVNLIPTSGTKIAVAPSASAKNRYKVVDVTKPVEEGKKVKEEFEVHLVIDSIACNALKMNDLVNYKSQIDVYVMVADKTEKDTKCRVDRKYRVSDIDFMNDFKEQADVRNYYRYLRAIHKYENVNEFNERKMAGFEDNSMPV